MINREVNPLRIICETRHLKQNLSISLAEILYILNSETLTSEEIAIWLIIAALTADSPKFSCTLTFQTLSEMSQVPTWRILPALTKLQHMGFLIVAFDETFKEANLTLHFPHEGLLALKKAPKIKEDKSNEVFYEWGFRQKEHDMKIVGIYKPPLKKKENGWIQKLSSFLWL